MPELINSNRPIKNRANTQNFKTALGGFNDAQNYDELNISEVSSFQDLEYYYLNPIVEKFCNVISDELSDSEIKLNCDDKIYDYISYDKIQHFFNQILEALILENIYGGCLIVSDRLDPLEQTEDYILVDASRAIPLDFTTYDNYQISNYLDTGLTVNKENYYKLNGRYLPSRLRFSNKGWGRSLVEVVINNVITYETSSSACTTLMRRLNTLIYGMKEFGEIIATENISGELMSNLNSIFEILEVYNILAIDSNLVNASYANRSLSGIEHLIDKAKSDLERIAMSTISMPSILLWGKAGTSGLADKGSSELDIWYKSCNNVLQRKCVPLLKWMVLNYIPYPMRREFSDMYITTTQLQENQQVERAQKEEIEEKALTLKQTRLIQLLDKGIISDLQLKQYLEIEDEKTIEDLAPILENSQSDKSFLELDSAQDEQFIYDDMSENDIQKAIEWGL